MVFAKLFDDQNCFQGKRSDLFHGLILEWHSTHLGLSFPLNNFEWKLNT